MPLLTSNARRLFARHSALAWTNALVFAILAFAMPGIAKAQTKVPGAPSSVSAGAGTTDASVRWGWPTEFGDAPISGYLVTMSPGSVQREAGHWESSMTFENLQKGTSYAFTVQAITSLGLGAPGYSNAVVPMSAPDAPVMGSAVLSGTSEVLVSFSPPASDGGSPINGYRVGAAYSSVVDLDEGSMALTHRLRGLPAGTPVTFRATARNAVGYGAGSAPSNAITVYPKLSVLDVTVVEGNSGTKTVSVEVRVDSVSRTDIQFDIATSNGTAHSGSDYVGGAATSQLLPWGSSYRLFTYTINGDAVGEGDENFTVSISNVVGAHLDKSQGTVTILDDDGAVTPSLAIDDLQVLEGNSGTRLATFTVTASQPTSTTMSFDIATADGTATAGSDYEGKALSGQTIAAGETTKTFAVTFNRDTAIEGDETFTVTLSNPVGATLADAQGVGTIVNDDAAMSIADVSIVEGTGNSTAMRFPVTLSVPLPFGVMFQVETIHGTATSDDYSGQSGDNWQIPAGQTSADVLVWVGADTKLEPDETFKVRISGGGQVISDNEAVGTILNDDEPPVPILYVNSASVAEGDSGTKVLDFIITMSEPTLWPVSFDVFTVAGSATADADYVHVPTTRVTIPAGAGRGTFSVTLNGDTAIEVDETFSLEARNISGGTFGNNIGTGTIVNDDVAVVPMVSIGDASVDEGNSGETLVTLPITLSAPPTRDVMFYVFTQDSTATADVDYVQASYPVTIRAGHTTATATVLVKGDTTPEPNETFSLRIGNPDHATLGKSVALVQIINDDGASIPYLMISGVQVVEGDVGMRTATTTVALSHASASDIAFGISTVDGSATAGSDYSAASVFRTLPAGELSLDVSFTVNADTEVEADEIFTLQLTAVQGATIHGAGYSQVLIRDDDLYELKQGPACKSVQTTTGSRVVCADRGVAKPATNNGPVPVSITRLETGGLYDDVDDGNRSLQLSTGEYALLLANVARRVCARAGGASVVGVDGVENLSTLADLADSTNLVCGQRYGAARMPGPGELGFLVQRDVQVLGVSNIGSARAVSVQAKGHAGPITVVLAAGQSVDLVERLRARLAANPGERIVLLGAGAFQARALAGLLVEVSAAGPPARRQKVERVLVSPSLKHEYPATGLDTNAPGTAPWSVLRLQH